MKALFCSGSSTSSSALDGSPWKSAPSLSTSSSMKSGLREPARRMPRTMLPGQRADVGAAVPADLGLVAHAAQRLAHELASQRARDRAAERGLAGAGRADEAQDGRARVGLVAAHHQVLEDALLDLLEAVVVLVEHRARVLQVEVVLGEHRPRHVGQPLEVGARHGVLGGLRRDGAQPRQLAVGLLAHVGRELRLLELGLELVDLALAVVALAQLLADGLHLLAQQELALVLVERLLDLVADLRADLEHLQLAAEDAGEQAQPLLGVERLEQLLLVLGRQVEQRGDEVGDLAGARTGCAPRPPPRRGWRARAPPPSRTGRARSSTAPRSRRSRRLVSRRPSTRALR